MIRLYYGAPPQSWYAAGMTQLPAARRKGRFLVSFDDGPGPHSLQLGDYVAQAGGRAVFFLAGHRLDVGLSSTTDVNTASERALSLHASGHVLGSHGLCHIPLARAGKDRIRTELKRSCEHLQNLTQTPVHWFRPPFGSWRPGLKSLLKELELELMFWSCNPKDWQAKGTEYIVSRTATGLREGDILLLHCTGRGEQQTLEALPLILENAARLGLKPLDARLLQEPIVG